jgi:eukaryotic-like serine/threonine-protein kinase
VPLRGEAGRKTYRIDERIGGGPATDDIFRAWHNVFQGPCVQKRVHVQGLEDALASNEPAFLDKLRHPHIVEVREAQWDPDQDGAITFVMRLYEGGSIEEALRTDYRFSVHQAIDLSVHVLAALAHVYGGYKAVHRDVKPGNVLMDKERHNAYLSDFGSASTVDANGEVAAVLGTDHYRPPEAKPSGKVNRTADLFGVGMTLFEMFNGRLLWETHDLAKVEERLRVGRRALPDSALSAYAPHIPDRLRRVVNKAIARNPGSRFNSPEEFIRALKKAKLQSIDWEHVDGDGLLGTWIGTWPAKRPVDKRTTYRVVSRILEAGRDRGKLRLEADYCKAGANSWREAYRDTTVGADDRTGVAGFFTKVEDRAAQREPAR